MVLEFNFHVLWWAAQTRGEQRTDEYSDRKLVTINYVIKEEGEADEEKSHRERPRI